MKSAPIDRSWEDTAAAYDWTTPIICDSALLSESKPEANSIKRNNPFTTMGSASNPIMIDDGENYVSQDELWQCDSDADTEVLSSPEFWANLNGNHVPLSETALTDLSSDLTSSKLPCKSFDCSASPLQLRKEKQKAVEITKDGHALVPQNKRQKCSTMAEAPTTSCGQPEPPLPCKGSTRKRSDITSKPLDGILLPASPSECLEKRQPTLETNVALTSRDS